MADKLSDRNADILDMWEGGISGPEIAMTLNMTRNAVMGAVRRLRLKGLVGYKPRQKSTRSAYVNQPAQEQAPFPYEGVPFHALNQFKECHYIVNDGPASSFLFCGRPQHDRSYCYDHYKLCYMPPKRRL
jgi:hypothetical protein